MKWNLQSYKANGIKANKYFQIYFFSDINEDKNMHESTCMQIYYFIQWICQIIRQQMQFKKIIL